MAVSCQVVRFQKDNSGTNGATQDVSLNFTPKAIIVYSDGNTADNTASAHYQWIQGFSDGTTHASVCAASDDADSPSDAATVLRNDSVFVRLDDVSNDNIISRASCAFSTNKVTFTWTVNNAESTYIHMIAYGGDSITNVKVAHTVTGLSAPGTQNYTGLGFNPVEGNAVLFILHPGHLPSTNTVYTGGAGLGFGCAVSSTKRWAICNISENGVNPSDTWRYYSDAHVFSGQSQSSGSVNQRADFNGWITDGFQFDWEAANSANRPFAYLVINGGTWDCGTLQSPTTPTNDVDTSVSVSSNTIRGLLMASTGLATLNTSSAVGVISIGATDGTTQTTIGMIDEDGQTTTDSYRVNNTTNIIRPLTTDGADLEVATFDSFSTNNFRLDWSTATASQEYYGWVVVADSVTTQQYQWSISDTISNSSTLASKRKRPLVITITNSDSITGRVAGHFRSLVDTVTNSSILARLVGHPLTSTITNSDSISKLKSVSRPLADTITNSSTLARIKSGYRSVSDTVTSSSTIEKEKESERSIVDSLTCSSTLTRISTIFRSVSDTIANSELVVKIKDVIRSINE